MNRPFAVRSAEVNGRVGRACVSRAANGSWPRFASNRWRFPLPMNLRLAGRGGFRPVQLDFERLTHSWTRWNGSVS
jgi:hypothetical protein